MQVTELYYKTGALSFAFISACLLAGQFAVVWLRVLPYLQVQTVGTPRLDPHVTTSSAGLLSSLQR